MEKRHYRRGRPDKWTQEREDRLVESLMTGHARTAACELAGVDYKTFLKWMDGRSMSHRDHLIPFATRVSDAEAAAEDRAVKVVSQAINVGNVKAATWWLERRRPQTYGRSQTVTHKGLESLSDEELMERARQMARKTVTDEKVKR